MLASSLLAAPVHAASHYWHLESCSSGLSEAGASGAILPGLPGYAEFVGNFYCVCDDPGNYPVRMGKHWRTIIRTDEDAIQSATKPSCLDDGTCLYWFWSEGDPEFSNYRSAAYVPWLARGYHNWTWNGVDAVDWEPTSGKSPGDADYYTKENITSMFKCPDCRQGKKVAASSAWMEVAEEPTCVKRGKVAYYALFEADGRYHGVEKEFETSFGSHTYGPWKVSKKATALNPGEKYRVCENDSSHIERESIPATGIKGTQFVIMSARGDKNLHIIWSKITGAEGYDIFFTNCGLTTTFKKVKTIKGNTLFAWSKTGLKKNTSYKVYVRAWAMKDGEKVYVTKSPVVHTYTTNGNKKYTVAKSVTVNKSNVTLDAGKSFTIKANIVKMDKQKKIMCSDHTAQLRYKTSNSKVATVSSSGKITAKGKGSCYVYVYAHNGVMKSVNVTVR